MTLFDKDTDITGANAVIYCRVSSSKQSKVGDGLGSQQTRCREYARYKGLTVAQTFSDDLSGSLTTRPGMKDMLSYLRKHRGQEPIVVIIDDISRLARGIEAHLQLRTAITEAGGVLKSPTIEFGEDSDSILVENMLASVSQHQRQKNAEQTINRMRARTMNGYWCFQAPIGYKYKSVPGHGKLLVRNEPYASILQEAFEGFATGRFDSQAEVKRFLEGEPEYPNDLPDGQIRNQRIVEMLTRPVYAGYVEAPNWNVSLRKGHHEGLISFETFERNRKRLQEGVKAPARKDINEDFPLRGFVLCGDCHKPLTACWSKSSTGKKHPYYHCYNRDCAMKRKSIPRAELEGAFEAILSSMQPAANVFKMACTMFEDAWEQRKRQAVYLRGVLQDELQVAEKKIDQLLSRIVETDKANVVAAYESKIAKLEKNKLLIREKLEKKTPSQRTFDQLFELALKFLENPRKHWDSGHIHLRKMVLRLAFEERLAYTRKEGFSNAKKSSPFKVLEGICGGQCQMAHP